MSSKIKLKNNLNTEFSIEHKDNEQAISVSSIDISKVKSVNTIADLRALAQTPPTIWVSGYHTKGDGAFGSHVFEWDATSTENDNGGTIIKLDSVTTGRYKLKYDGNVNVKWFGAELGNDIYSILQNIIDNGCKSIEISEDYEISNTVTLKDTELISYNNSTLTASSTNSVFEVESRDILIGGGTVNTSTDITADSSNNVKTVVTMTDTTGLSVGDTIRVVGVATDEQAFVTEIRSLTPTEIECATVLEYTVNNPTIYKVVSNKSIIKGFNFETSFTQTSLISLHNGSIVSECSFTGDTTCVSCASSYVSVINNKFSNVNTAMIMYNASHCLLRDNIVTGSSQGIRAVRCEGLKILNNRIADGSNVSHGLGIELTAESGNDKNIHNLVDGNTIINASKGVAGSGIGGIHLNFQANRNTITNNISQHNSFGIYLENNCNYNIIANNDCSYNDGWYGVGIELDYDNSHNKILNNICSWNRGSTGASESSGIQIRNSTDHPNNYNDISNNTIANNGLEGIRCYGNYTNVIGNTLYENAYDITEHATEKSSSKGWGIRVLGNYNNICNNSIEQNAYDSRDSKYFSQRAIGLTSSEYCNVIGNTVNANYYCFAGIYVDINCNNINIKNNIVVASTANGSAIKIYGEENSSSTSSNIYIDSNIVSQNSNTKKAISLYYVDKYSIFANALTGDETTIETPSCTNRYSPADN